MAASLPLYFPPKFWDGAVVAAGYSLYAFEDGTTTDKAVFTTAAGDVEHDQPIILDAAGEIASGSGLFLGTGAYTFRLNKTSALGGGVVRTWNGVEADSGALDAVTTLEATLASTSGSASVGWSQAGTGATTKTVSSKLRERVSADDYSTLDQAVAAVADGGTIDVPIGSFGPLTANLTKSIRFIGRKKPAPNSGLTGLEKGSIIRGPLIYLADNCHFENIGVDSGSDVCTAYYGGAAQEGLVCTVSHATRTYTGNTFNNVCAITKDAASSVHTFAAESQESCSVDGVQTYLGLYGAVFKTTTSNIDRVTSTKAGQRGIYIKRDESSLAQQSNFSNLIVKCQATTLYGLTLETRRSDDGVTSGNMFQLNVTNFVVDNPAAVGVVLQGGTTSSDTLADCLISNGTVFGAAVAGVTGMQRIGKLRRVKVRGVRFLSCPQFGLEDYDALGFDSEISGCDAVSCGTGFKVQGNGTKYYANHAESCTGYGHYLAGVSAVYRAMNTGRSNGSGDFGGDGASPWFELGSFVKTEIKTPTLINSWVDNGGTFEGARYYKGTDGRVHITGAIKSGTLNTAAFVLPTAYCPTHDKRFVAAGLAAGVLTPVDIFVETSGNVTPIQGTNAFVPLDGISFLSPDTDPL